MAYLRRARKVGNSVVVAIPAEIRRHVRLTRSWDVYWHRGETREAILTLHAQRRGGRPGTGDAVKQLDEARAEVERLTVKLAARPMAVYREGYSHGFGAGLAPILDGLVAVDRLRADVQALAAEVARLSGRRKVPRVAGAEAPAVLAQEPAAGG